MVLPTSPLISMMLYHEGGKEGMRLVVISTSAFARELYFFGTICLCVCVLALCVQVVGDTATGPGGFPISGSSSYSVGVSCGFESDDAITLPWKIASTASEAKGTATTIHPSSEERTVGSVMTLSQAWTLVDLALAAAAHSHAKSIAIAVVDVAANVKAIATTDDCPEGYAALALSKVRKKEMKIMHAIE